MARVIWTPVAQSDLDDILFFVSVVDRRPITGERLYYELRDRVFDQAHSKRPGHVHPNAPSGWLYFKHKRWLVFYI
jgi:plasmid stabilization system protein ParE